jgi:hypothetical protein
MKTYLYLRENDTNPLSPIATITIEHDRISYIELIVAKNKLRLAFTNKFEVSYFFELDKLSKADIPRKKFGMSHEISAKWADIKELGYYNNRYSYFIKISKPQEFLIKWNKKLYYIQSKALKVRIIDWFIGGAIGYLISFLFHKC